MGGAKVGFELDMAEDKEEDIQWQHAKTALQ